LTAPAADGRGALAQARSLVTLKLVNKDSTLFGSFKPYDQIPTKQMLVVEGKFASWLGAHGGVDAALPRWGGEPVRGDEPRAGRVGVLGLDRVLATKNARAVDTSRFLAESMRDFYATTYHYLKTELGYDGAIVCSNWLTANERVFGPLDKW